MANIKAILNKKKQANTLNKPTEEIIFMQKLNDAETVHELRGYNGLSSIGNKCIRQMQLAHYNCYTVTLSARIERLFGFGHLMEPVLRAELLDKLCIESTGDQDEVIGFAGHWKGHIDGIGRFLGSDDYFLEEFKTHNAKSFADLKKKGVKESKPGHYDQMEAYMGYKNLKLALYVAYNKDNSEIWVEWVKFDEEHFFELKRREGEVVMSDVLLPRIGNNNKTWFECKMCDCKDECFGDKPIHKSCKNCQHVDILDGGVWECTKGHGKLSEFNACEQYELMEMLCELN